MILPLRGIFKGESSESYHLVVVTVKSNSGLQIGPWIKRALEWRERRRTERGFLFVDESGRRATLKGFDGEILERIARVQSSFPELILSSVNVHEE